MVRENLLTHCIQGWQISASFSGLIAWCLHLSCKSITVYVECLLQELVFFWCLFSATFIERTLVVHQSHHLSWQGVNLFVAVKASTMWPNCPTKLHVWHRSDTNWLVFWRFCCFVQVFCIWTLIILLYIAVLSTSFHHFSTFPSALQDLAGGIIVTLPADKEFRPALRSLSQRNCFSVTFRRAALVFDSSTIGFFDLRKRCGGTFAREVFEGKERCHGGEPAADPSTHREYDHGKETCQLPVWDPPFLYFHLLFNLCLSP